MKSKLTEPARKQQPCAEQIVALSKVIEALEPLYSFHTRRQVLIAALTIIDESLLARAVMDAR